MTEICESFWEKRKKRFMVWLVMIRNWNDRNRRESLREKRVEKYSRFEILIDLKEN